MHASASRGAAANHGNNGGHSNNEQRQQQQQQHASPPRAVESRRSSSGPSETRPRQHLETLLMNKNRALESRIVTLKGRVRECDESVRDLQHRLSAAESAVRERDELIEQWERSPTATSRDEQASAAASPSPVALSADAAVAAPSASASASSLLSIVCGQRDRFRNRVHELEEEIRKLVRNAADAQAALESLRHDNVQLYEKIRYLQSYNNNNNGGGGGAELEEGLRKYRSQYEEQLNPFTLFSRRERLRRLQELSAPERAVVRMGQRLLSARVSRLFLFFYSVSLHVLVFLTLYKMQHVSQMAHHAATSLTKTPPPPPPATAAAVRDIGAESIGAAAS